MATFFTELEAFWILMFAMRALDLISQRLTTDATEFGSI